MDVIIGLRSHLLGAPAITALIAARVYTPIIPQKATFPCVQVQLISDIDGFHLRGPDLLPTDRLQVDAWAATRDQARELGRLCRQRVNGFAGAWMGDPSTSPAGQLQILLARYVDGSERFEADIHGGFMRHSADYLVTFRDSSDEVLI